MDKKKFFFILLLASIFGLTPPLYTFITLYSGNQWDEPPICEYFPEDWREIVPENFGELNMSEFMSFFIEYLPENWTELMPLHWEYLSPDAFMINYCCQDYHAGEDLFGDVFKSIVQSPLIAVCGILSTFGGIVMIISTSKATDWFAFALITILPLFFLFFTMINIIPVPPEIYEVYGSDTPSETAKNLYLLMFFVVVIILTVYWGVLKYASNM